MSGVRVLTDAPWIASGPAARVLALLNGDGEEARVVGGAVRNALLKIPIGDVDIATTAVPDEVVRRARAAGIKCVPTGIDHGTVTLVIDAHPFEVTTLREDVETFGRKASVRFGRDWKADAERRDFTMNALSVKGDGTLCDYVGGLADLRDRRVRFIGDPAKRIGEDYLRILRFFRFHAAYGHGAPDAAGLEAETLVQADRLRVRDAHLERVAPSRVGGRDLEEALEERRGDAATPEGGRDGHVHDVPRVDVARDERIADELALLEVGPERDRAGLAQLGSEHRARPGRRVRGPLDLLDRVQVPLLEAAQLDVHGPLRGFASGART